MLLAVTRSLCGNHLPAIGQSLPGGVSLTDTALSSALLHALYNRRLRSAWKPSNSSLEASHPTDIQAVTHSSRAPSVIPSFEAPWADSKGDFARIDR